MNQQINSGNFFVNVCLVWFWSATLDSIFPELNLFVHIIFTILFSFFSWFIVANIILPIVDLIKHRKMIIDLLEQGKDPKEIIAQLNEKHKDSIFEFTSEKIENDIEEEPEVNSTKEVEMVTFLDTDKPPFGYYMDEPIFEKIMVDGIQYIFKGTVDLSKVKKIIVEPNSIILKTGLIYTKDNA